MNLFHEPPDATLAMAILMTSAAEEPSGSAREDRDREAAKLVGKSALVVEDEYLVGLDMMQVLEEWGLKVTGPVQTLAESVSTAAERVWDFAILDVSLDGTDTLDLARDLLKRGICVIFVTAYADYDSRFSGDLAKVPRLGKPTPYRTLKRLMIDAAD